MPHTASESIPPQLIDEALKRVLVRRGFRASAQKQRFLEFVVQEALIGRTDRIKRYTITVDVFGRDARFDPLLDPLVRIHASRLR
ncbi:hypothetical protein [Azospirillum doebereinerae]